MYKNHYSFLLPLNKAHKYDKLPKAKFYIHTGRSLTNHDRVSYALIVINIGTGTIVLAVFVRYRWVFALRYVMYVSLTKKNKNKIDAFFYNRVNDRMYEE